MSGQSAMDYTSENLKVEAITTNLFVHISYLSTEDYGKVPCNGAVYINENEAVVFDAPTNNKASAELILWIQNTLKKKIKAVVATHFHIDCLGGLQQFHENGIPSYANELTITYAKENNGILPQNSFNKQMEINLGEQSTTVAYYGAGHTRDNVIAYIPSERAIFGGCLVKGIRAGKGNLADADVKAWPKTIARIQKELPQVEIVIPGHGKKGGTELLEYTKNMFEEKK